jgi:hypothetical protein
MLSTAVVRIPEVRDSKLHLGSRRKPQDHSARRVYMGMNDIVAASAQEAGKALGKTGGLDRHQVHGATETSYFTIERPGASGHRAEVELKFLGVEPAHHVQRA